MENDGRCPLCGSRLGSRLIYPNDVATIEVYCTNEECSYCGMRRTRA